MLNIAPLTRGLFSPLMTPDVTALRSGGGVAKIIRAAGQGTRPMVQGFAGLTSRAATFRHPFHFQWQVKRAKLRLGLFYRTGTGTVGSPWVDTLFPNPLDFQFGISPTYVDDIVGLPVRQAFTFGGANYYSYPGPTTFAAANPAVMHVDSDWIDFPAGTTLGDLHETVEVPTGQTPSNSLPWTKAAANLMPRPGAGNIGMTSSASSHIAVGFALNSGVGASPTLPITKAPSTAGGLAGGFTCAFLIVETDAGTKTILIHGSSHGEGANEGVASDTYNGTVYADAMGDANCNRGMFETAAWEAGYNYVNISSGGEWAGNCAVTANTIGRRALIADLVFDHIWHEHSFNDLNKNVFTTSWVAAGTTVKKGDCSRGGNLASGNAYMCTKAGLTAIGANGVTGTGAGIADGTSEWMYIGAHISTTVNPAYGAFGGIYAHTAVMNSMFPGVPITGNLPLPNPSSTDNFLTVANQTAETAGGAGTGTASRRGLLHQLMKTRHDLLPNVINESDPSAYLENNHAALDGKYIVDGVAINMVAFAGHLNGYGAFLGKQGAPPALLQAAA